MRKNQIKKLSLFIYFTMALSFAAGRCYCQDIEFLSRLDDLSLFTNRLIFDWALVRFFIIDERKNLDPVLPRIGFSSFLLSFGPVSKRGLLREASNPLGFSSGSDLFPERTGIVPDISCDESKDDFVLMSPIPGILSVFIISDWKVVKHAGGIFQIPYADKSFIELLVLDTEPGEIKPLDSWYTDENRYAGGRIYHGGARAYLRTETCSLHSSLLFSENAFYQPGFLADSGFTFTFDLFRIEGLFGYASDTYMTPEYTFTDKMIQAEALVSISPVKTFTCTIKGGIDLDRPGLIPSGYIPATDFCSAEIEATLPIGKLAALGIDSSLHYTDEFDKNGKDKKTVKARLAVSWETDVIELDSGIKADFKDISLANAVVPFAFSLSLLSHSLSISCALGVYPDFDLGAKCKYEYTFGSTSLFISLGLKKPLKIDGDIWYNLGGKPLDYFEMTIGCEAKKKG